MRLATCMRGGDGVGTLAGEGSGTGWRATWRRRRGLPERPRGAPLSSNFVESFFSLISSSIYSCMDVEGIDFR